MTGRQRLLQAATTFAVATVLLQIAYPLTPDGQLGRLSVLTVLVACAACLTHGLGHWGAGPTAAFCALVLVGAFAVEALGVATGFPFGAYEYAHSLGPLVASVPLLVPCAWLMMAYPCLLMAAELTSNLVAPQRFWPWVAATAALGALGLAGWDVFLDPQMVAAGHWSWRHPHPGLPGVAQVPLTNLAGWFGAGAALLAAAALVVRPALAARRLRTWPELAAPTVLLAWTWVGGVVANAVFFHRPAVAVWGGLLLGLVVAPYLLLVRARVLAGRR